MWNRVTVYRWTHVQTPARWVQTSLSHPSLESLALGCLHSTFWFSIEDITITLLEHAERELLLFCAQVHWWIFWPSTGNSHRSWWDQLCTMQGSHWNVIKLGVLIMEFWTSVCRYCGGLLQCSSHSGAGKGKLSKKLTHLIWPGCEVLNVSAKMAKPE